MNTQDPLLEIAKKYFNIDYLFPYQRLVISNILEALGAELTARMLREQLSRDNIFFYHAGLDREEKNRIQKWFHDSKDGIWGYRMSMYGSFQFNNPFTNILKLK